MKWNTFYYDFYEYSEKKMISCINQLEDMGSTAEIIDFINSSDYESASKALIEKALKNGVRFSSDDLGELECNFDDDFFKQIVSSKLAAAKSKNAKDKEIMIWIALLRVMI